MNTSIKLVRPLLAAFLCIAALQSAAAGESGEIPVTTKSNAGMTDFIAGQAAMDRGDGAQANLLFRSAVSADPSFAYAWYNLGNVSFSFEEFATSLKKAQSVSSEASEGERMLIEINMRFLDNDFENQLALSEKLVHEYPHSARAWLNLAGVQAGLNQFAESRKSLKKAMAIDNHLAVLHTTMAASYLFNAPKDFSKAEKYYKNAIELQPGESNHYWGLGDVYRASQDLERAREFYTRATQLDPHDGTAFVKKGHVNSFLGNYDEARGDYDAGVNAAQPQNKPFLANYKTFTWVHAGDAQAAVNALDNIYEGIDSTGMAADQRNGAKIFTLTNAATICMHTDMYDDADRVLTARAEVLRANAVLVGTEEFERIQEANIAYFEGQLAARQGDYRKATRLAKSNAKLVEAQDNPRKMENYHDLMGLIHLEQGDYDKAVEHYRQANLTVMYTKYHLAKALYGAGNKTEAQRLFNEVGAWNFNSVGYALVRKDAIQRGS